MAFSGAAGWLQCSTPALFSTCGIRQLLESERRADVEQGRVWTIAELEDMTLDELMTALPR